MVRRGLNFDKLLLIGVFDRDIFLRFFFDLERSLRRFFVESFNTLLLFGVVDRVRVLTVVRRVRSLNLSVVRRSRDSVCEPLKSKSGVFKAVAPLLTDLGAFWYL